MLGWPLRPAGYLLILACGLLLIGVLANRPRRRAGKAMGAASASGLSLLLLLTVASCVFQVTLVLALPAKSGMSVPGLPGAVPAHLASLLGSLPWLLAAGLLGIPEAAGVAFLGGLVRGGMVTHLWTTPITLAVQAALVACLIRQDFREWPARLARHPVAASLSGGALAFVLYLWETYSATPGTMFDALEFTWSLTSPVLLGVLLEAGVGGMIAEVVSLSLPNRWYRPERLRAGPYNRSLTGRLVAVFAGLGLAGAMVLLIGDWVLARAEARELIGGQMQQTAQAATAGVPYFIQVGRTQIHELARAVSFKRGAAVVDSQALSGWLRASPFFSQVIILSPEREVLAAEPDESAAGAFEIAALEPALSAAMLGVPQEITLAAPAGSSARLAYLLPLSPTDRDPPSAVVVAWTELASNPLLAPALDLLRGMPSGEAFLLDARNQQILPPDADLGATQILVPDSNNGEVVSLLAPDGTRQLAYAAPVAGYPWRVLALVPQRTVDSLALRIAARLFLVVLTVGAVMMVVVYLGSRRLTRPLRDMAGAAERIAHGDLSRPVPPGGEDETGRLASSFEKMRLSLQTRLREMELLLATSQQMGAHLDLDRLLPGVLPGLRDLVHGDLARVVLAPLPSDEPGGPTAFAEGDDPGKWSELDPQILDLCRQRGRFVLENPARARTVLHLDGITSPPAGLVALPLAHEGEFVGVLWLGFLQPRMLTTDDLQLLTIIAAQLGISVANARLYLQAERERVQLSAVLEATPDAVLLVDRAGRVTVANPAAEVVLSMPAEEAIGRAAAECIPSADLLALLTQPQSDLRTLEVPVPPSRVLFASASDITQSDGTVTGRVCALWDVTQFKRLDMLKSEFVATVSHDLRAPLTLMRGYSTMLSMVGSVNDQQKDFLRKIQDSIEQMTQLVDNLLDLGRLEAGVGLSLEIVQPQVVVREVADSFRPQALNKRIEIELAAPESLSPIQADGTLLRQALANLLDNAIKYTRPGGKVIVRARQHSGRQSFSVEDNGLGIAPTDQARLFEKFYRARHREALKERGTGLGLAIVKSIAEQHGGRITVESQLGSGSVFTLEVPMVLVDPRKTRA